MRGMILAAGRGTRMGALTQQTPKPLLRVNGQYLIEYAIHQLKQANICDIVINVSYFAQQIIDTIGNGSRYDVRITYSVEAERLETGGGIVKALPLLGSEPFIVVSSDIVTQYPLQHLLTRPLKLAHLIMVPNPSYHPEGDFGFNEDLLSLKHQPKYTFANIGMYHPALFVGCEVHHFPLSKVLLPALEKGMVTGELFQGLWYNVGSPQDIEILHTATSLSSS